MSKVVIVVLNYNGEKCLLKTLKSLKALAYQDREIVVVDNNSEDESLSQAKSYFPENTYISLPKNGGFAYGMNKGICYALKQGAEYVWLFNYDAVADKESLEPLVVEATRQSDRVILSPLIKNSQGNIWFSGGRINFWRMRVEHEFRSLVAISRTNFLTGCALFVPLKVIKEVGLLDESFFLYYEDADYSLRAKKADIPLEVVPASCVFHSEASEQGAHKVYYLVYSGLLFFHKHAKGIFPFYQAIYVILRRGKNHLDLLFRKPQAKQVARAYHDYYVSRDPRHLSYFR